MLVFVVCVLWTDKRVNLLLIYWISAQEYGILVSFGFNVDAIVVSSQWYAPIILFILYLVSTALVFWWVVKSEEKR